VLPRLPEDFLTCLRIPRTSQGFPLYPKRPWMRAPARGGDECHFVYIILYYIILYYIMLYYNLSILFFILLYYIILYYIISYYIAQGAADAGRPLGALPRDPAGLALRLPAQRRRHDRRAPSSETCLLGISSRLQCQLKSIGGNWYQSASIDSNSSSNSSSQRQQQKVYRRGVCLPQTWYTDVPMYRCVSIPLGSSSCAARF